MDFKEDGFFADFIEFRCGIEVTSAFFRTIEDAVHFIIDRDDIGDTFTMRLAVIDVFLIMGFDTDLGKGNVDKDSDRCTVDMVLIANGLIVDRICAFQYGCRCILGIDFTIWRIENRTAV